MSTATAGECDRCGQVLTDQTVAELARVRFRRPLCPGCFKHLAVTANPSTYFCSNCGAESFGPSTEDVCAGCWAAVNQYPAGPDRDRALLSLREKPCPNCGQLIDPKMSAELGCGGYCIGCWTKVIRPRLERQRAAAVDELVEILAGG